MRSCMPACVLVVLMLLQGCMVGPNYVRPTVPMERKWPRAKGTTSLRPADTTWWRCLNDPLLERLIRMGVRRNLNIKEAEARVRESRALRAAAAADLLPYWNASTLYNNSRLSGNAGIVSQLPPGLVKLQQNLYQVGFDAGWEMDIFGGTRREVESAQARSQSSIEAYRDVMISVMGEIARNYVEVRGAQAQLAIAEKNIQIQEKTLALVQAKLEARIGSRLEVEQARAQLERTRAVLPSLRASIRAGAYSLGVLTGRPPRSLLEKLLATAPLPVPPDVVPMGLPSELLLRRPDIRQAGANLHAATANIGMATAQLFPHFSLTGSQGFASAGVANFFVPGSLAWSYGPTVTLPIFQGGRIRANIAAQEARRDAALAKYRQTVLAALQEVETSLARYSEGRLESERLAKSAVSQQKAVELAKVRFKDGVQGFLPVLDAQGRLEDVENSLAVSRTRVLVNLIGLYKALGGGWEQAKIHRRAAERAE